MKTTPLFVMLAALLVGACTRAADDDSEDTEPSVDTDADSDSDGACDPIERSDFNVHQVSLCRYALSCPNSEFETLDECRSTLSFGWDGTGCWDGCRAEQCADWLATGPECTDFNAVPDFCVRVADCS